MSKNVEVMVGMMIFWLWQPKKLYGDCLCRILEWAQQTIPPKTRMHSKCCLFCRQTLLGFWHVLLIPHTIVFWVVNSRLELTIEALIFRMTGNVKKHC